MILNHEFRGNSVAGVDACTFVYPGQTVCGKPRIEHVQSQRKHQWGRVVLRVRNVPTPVMACTRPMCFVKWWPDHGEPLGECKGL